MKHIIIHLIILLSVVASAAARTVQMTLHAAKTTDPMKKYALLPKADEQTEADAATRKYKAHKVGVERTMKEISSSTTAGIRQVESMLFSNIGNARRSLGVS